MWLLNVMYDKAEEHVLDVHSYLIFSKVYLG